MKKYLSIVLSLSVVFTLAFFVKSIKEKPLEVTAKKSNIGTFNREKSCVQQPNFLRKLRISSPVAIDLSQQNYKGLAFLHGKGLKEAVHLKSWEKFDHFSAYALTPKGDMFLTPMPYISVKKKTFEFQKNIYKLDSNSGKLSIWMTLEDVTASSNNPYGVIAVEYDCSDNSLWVSAIDETDYRNSRGVVYNIDISTRKILQKVEGIDALTLKLVKSEKGRFLLAGMAKENALNAYAILDNKLQKKPIKLLELDDSNEHIRKISIIGKSSLKVKSIPFSYSLIAQTQESSIRREYIFNLEKL